MAIKPRLLNLVRPTKKKVVILVAIFIFIIVPLSFFGMFIFSVQVILDEGQQIISQRCQEINPLVATRKAKNYEFYKLMTDGVSKDQVVVKQEEYKKASIEYIDKEKEWLEEYKTFLDGKEAQFFLPSDVYQNENYRYQLIKKDFDVVSIMAYLIEKPDYANATEENSQQLYQTIQARDNLNEAYDRFLATPKQKPLILNFVKVPTLDCPEENQNIPDYDIEELFMPKVIPDQVELTG